MGQLPAPRHSLEESLGTEGLCLQTLVSHSCLRQGTPEGGARGTTAWSTQAATSSSKKSCSSPGVVCGDFLSLSCLLCSPSTSLGLLHPHPFSKNSALQIAMTSVRMILCIKIIFCLNKWQCPQAKTLQAEGLHFYPDVTLPGSATDRITRLTGKSALQ